MVLVDESGHEIGLMGKQEAHEKGLLHKAISIIIYNSEGEMMIQQRAYSKYHWAGIWSNSCCSHPRENESYSAAAHRRLYEELGFQTILTEEFSFIYKAYDEPSGMTEHEFDTVFTGVYDGDMNLNADEVEAIEWIQVSDLLTDIDENPAKYSFWFKIILEELKQKNKL